MSENLRFPSGKTVLQAKKDAKKKSKRLNIELHEAQDLIAKESGIDMPWKDAIHFLNNQGKPIVGFNFDGRYFQLTRNKPNCLIGGCTGSGKTVTAYIIAEHHLRAGKPVHIESIGLGLNSSYEDLALTLLKKLIKEYKDLITVNEWSFHNTENIRSQEFTKTLTPDTLLIFDEAHFLSKHLPIQSLIKQANNQSCAVIITSQDVKEFEMTGFTDNDFEHVGIVFLGKGQTSSRFKELAELLNSRLNMKPGEYSEFLAMDGTDWADVVKINAPSWT